MRLHNLDTQEIPAYDNVDLHCHSTVSDGVLAPADVAARAASQGVKLWALTDHDEVSGVAAARQAAHAHGMDFVTGVEVSVTWGGRTIHIVGLGVDETYPDLLKGLATNRSGRRHRAKRIGERLEALGMPGACAGAMALATNPEMVSRTHFARFLLDQGHAKNLQEIFDRYLGDGKPGNEPMTWASLEDGMQWIRDAGGVAIIAHPGRYNLKGLQLTGLLETFRDLGGTGIEIHTGSHHPNEYAHWADIARQYQFAGSIGSDFHSVRDGRVDLGEMPPLPTDIEPVWHGVRIEPAPR